MNDLQSPVVLYAEDQPDVNRLLHLTLANRGFRVVGAADGDAAWASVLRERPQVCVLDVRMPGRCDGLEICRRIKADPALAGMYVILLTASGQHRDMEQGRQAGADAYIVKPFSPIELRARIHGALQAPSAQAGGVEATKSLK